MVSSAVRTWPFSRGRLEDSSNRGAPANQFGLWRRSRAGWRGGTSPSAESGRNVEQGESRSRAHSWLRWKKQSAHVGLPFRPRFIGRRVRPTARTNSSVRSSNCCIRSLRSLPRARASFAQRHRERLLHLGRPCARGVLANRAKISPPTITARCRQREQRASARRRHSSGPASLTSSRGSIPSCPRSSMSR